MADQRQEQSAGHNNKQASSIRLSDIMYGYYTQTQYGELKRLLYDKTFPIAQSFINLALVKDAEQKNKGQDATYSQLKEKESQIQFRDARLNSFEDIHKPKESIPIEQIFAQFEDKKIPGRILIEGRAGIGKTTLCQFIANQWAEDNGKLKTWHAKFKLLIWLPLRDLIANNKFNFADKNFDLAELVYSKFLNRAQCRKYTSDDIRAQLQELVANQQLLLLLDGYDEIVPSMTSNNDFKEFFEEELLTCPNWILTSRPLYATNIKADRLLEIIGFISEDIPIYAQQFFKDIAKEDQVEDLLKLLESNKNIHGIAHIPINLELICSVWEQEGPSLGTQLNMTGLYDKLVLNLFKRYLHKFHQRKLTDLTWEEINSFSSYDFCSMVKFLEKLAWEGMQQPGIVLNSSLIKQSARELWTDDNKEKYSISVLKDLGLLKSLGVAKSSILDHKHYFIHLTFQEYFAARYVVNHLHDKTIQTFICVNKFNKRYEIVWWFVAGLLGLNPTSPVISSASEKSVASASTVALRESASAVISAEQVSKKSKLVTYFNLLSAESRSLLPVHDQVLQWRCWDEAGLPDLVQKELWIKNLLIIMQPQKGISGYKAISQSIKLGLSQSPRLLQHYGFQFIQPWLALLQDKDGDVRACAAKVLGALQAKDRWIIERLLVLLQDRDRDVWAQVTRILAALRVKGRWVLERLLVLLQDEDKFVRIRVAEALIALQVKERWVVERLLILLQEQDKNVRAQATKILVALQVKERPVVEQLLALLKENDESFQFQLAEELLNLQVKERWVVERLLVLLQDEDKFVRIQVAEALIALQVKEPEVIKGLFALLQDKYSIIQVRAAKVLGALQVKEPVVIKSLLVLLKDKFNFVRAEAATILISLQVKERWIIECLLALLQDADKSVRVQATRILVDLQVKEPVVIKGLFALLQYEDRSVRAQAVEIFVTLQVKGPEVIKGLLALLQDGDKSVRAQATWILRVLQVKEPEAIEGLLLLLRDKSGYVRSRAAKALVALQVKKPEVINGLLALLQDEDRSVRAQVADVLEQIVSEDELLIHFSGLLNQQIEYNEWNEFSLSLLLRLWLQFTQNNSLFTCFVDKIINSDTLVYYYDGQLYMEGRSTPVSISVEQYQVLQQAINKKCHRENIPILDINSQLHASETVISPATLVQEKSLADFKPQLFPQTLFFSNMHVKNKLLTINLLQGKLFKHPSKEQQTILSIFNEVTISAQKNQKVKKILHQQRTLAVEEDNYKNTLIHYAAFLGCENLVAELLVANKGAAGSKNKYGLQALHIAAFKGHKNLVRQLLQNYGDASVLELDLAYEAQAFYVSKPPQPIRFKIKCSTLGFSVLGGQVDVVKELLQQLQQPDKSHLVNKEIIIDGIGNILHLAVLSRHALVLKTLVHHDFVIQHPFLYNQLNKHQLTPLSLAVRIYNQTAIHILASHPKIKLNQLTEDRNRSVLHEAVKARNLEAIEVILNLISEGESALSLLNIQDMPKRDKLDRRTAHNLAVIIAKNSKVDQKTVKEYKLIAGVLNGHDLTSWQQLREKPSVRRPRIRNLVFQGGGPRGIAFIEALSLLEKKLSSTIERVCGSSAGAITAGAVALGYDAKDLVEKLGSLDLACLLDLEIGKDLTSHIQAIKQATSLEGGNTSSYASLLWDAFKDKVINGDLLFHRQVLLNKFQQLEGLCKGTSFLDWFNKNIIVNKLKADGIATRYPEIDINNFTFKDLCYLIDKGEPYKHLHLYTFCIEGELAEVVMNSEDSQWDNVRVADAVHASMSIPGVFKPQIINGKKYVDGGLFINMPIKCFDKVKYLNRYLKGDDNYEVFNEETLGFRLAVTPKSAADTISKINNPIDLLKALISAFYNAEAIIAAAEDKYRYRCIAIPDCDVGLLDFDLPETKKQELLTASSKAMAEYFEEYEEVVRERQTIESCDHPEDASQAATPMR